MPTSAREIQNRLNEITFNAALLRELRAIDFVNRLIDDGKLSDDEYKRVADAPHRRRRAAGRAHLLVAAEADGTFLQRLRDIGRAAAKGWLKRNYEAIGKRERSTSRRRFREAGQISPSIILRAHAAHLQAAAAQIGSGPPGCVLRMRVFAATPGMTRCSENTLRLSAFGRSPHDTRALIHDHS